MKKMKKKLYVRFVLSKRKKKSYFKIYTSLQINNEQVLILNIILQKKKLPNRGAVPCQSVQKLGLKPGSSFGADKI
jgi:hypothetical protein